MSFICKAPWTSIAFQPTGVAPCCMFKLEHVEPFRADGSLFENIRQQFLDGQIPDGCKNCQDSISTGNETNAYYHQFRHYQTDFKTLDIQEINLRSNNFCNLSCRSCGPHFSSKWEQEFHGKVIVSKDTSVFDKLKTLDLTKLKTVVNAGGEPTITEEHCLLLQQLLALNHTTPVIRIATNLQVLEHKQTNLLDLWQHFPNLYLNISIDGVGSRAANIRSGTKWENMLKNLDALKKTKIRFRFNITVSALNIWFLEETLDFLAQNFSGKQRNFNMLYDPDILSICVIPAKYREDLYKMLDRCDTKKYNVEQIRSHLNSDDTSHLWDSFLLYNLMLDVRRDESFVKSLPFFQELCVEKTLL